MKYTIDCVGALEMKMHKLMTILMPDGSKWGVPVEMMVRHRAAHYVSVFSGNINRSRAETIRQFESDASAIAYWARHMMNWSAFDGHQVKVSEAPPIDFQEAWMSGEVGYVE